MDRDADAIAALRAENEALKADFAKLADPVAVHINMLRGNIAKPSWRQIKHIYPLEADAEYKLALEDVAEERDRSQKLAARLADYEGLPLSEIVIALSFLSSLQRTPEWTKEADRLIARIREVTDK